MLDPFDAAQAANERRAQAAAIERLKHERATSRDNQPLPAGSLFDEVTRNQQELF